MASFVFHVVSMSWFVPGIFTSADDFQMTTANGEQFLNDLILDFLSLLPKKISALKIIITFFTICFHSKEIVIALGRSCAFFVL